MTTARSSLRLAGLLAFVATLIVACSAPSALPAPAAPAAATTAGTAGAATTPGTALSVDRVTAHLKALAVDIGIRSAGSEEERRAARYIAGVLTDAGYTATIEPFTFSMPAEESSSVTIEGGKPFTARLIEGSALGLATGALVDGGTGTATQIEAAGARGRVVLVRRGDIPFSSKVANAAQAGAVAVLVVNNESGQFRGTLGRETASIPALAIDGGQWEALRAALGRTINLDASRSTKTVTSQNVVGRRGATCRAYIGSHYDSVPEGPGANDNASGTASMLEIARVRATDGLCAIAFGSEETGLNGSQAFVRDHSPKGAVFMVNFDMMGRIERPIVVGDRDLTQRIMGIIKQLPNQPLKPGVFPPFASSDHVSFSSVGVPAVTITAGDDDNMHTPKDNADGIQKADLQTMLNLGDTAVGGLLKALAEGGQPPP